MGPEIVCRPLTPDLMDSLGDVLRGSWGSTCWCMHPRLTEAGLRALPGDGPAGPRRRRAMEALAGRPSAPGLVAFAEGEPVGWIAVGPRGEYARIEASRATPRVDGADVWVIPCLTVRTVRRGRGITLPMIRAAVGYAAGQGARAVEAYPRADAGRVGDDSAYFGTEAMFRRAGFARVRGPLANRPRNWTPRVAMRIVPAVGCAADRGG